MSRILAEINARKIRKDFALMGGSAIVFLHRDMYRFSTDLDLDFIGNKRLGRGGPREVRNRIEQDRKALEGIASDLGVELSLAKMSGNVESAIKRRFIQYAFKVPSQFRKSKVAVEVDVSYRYCHSVLGPVHKTWPISAGGLIPKFEVQTLKAEELYAGKIIALLAGETAERMDFPNKIGLLFKRKIRHLYDIYLLAEELDTNPDLLDTALLRSLVLLFGMSRIKHFAFFRGDNIAAYDEEDRKVELIPVVSPGKPTPTAEHMKWAVRKFLDRTVFSYGDDDYEFIEDFTAKNFRPQKILGNRFARPLRQMFFYEEMLEKVAPLNQAE